MKKTILLAVLFVGVLFCAVGYADSQYRTALGHHVPSLVLPQADSVLRYDRSDGDYVLLNFWTSVDAPSRRQANEYTAWIRNNPEAPVKLISVNFDHSRGMFSEIVKLDSLIPASQYYAEGDTARAIIDNFGLNRGYGSLLISPEGKIIAHNPTDAQLSQYSGK